MLPWVSVAETVPAVGSMAKVRITVLPTGTPLAGTVIGRVVPVELLFAVIRLVTPSV